MKEKGWHEVRLIDASGEPINEDNRPKDAFERSGHRGARGRQTLLRRAGRQGRSSQYLRAATPIPVVMEKCTMCHENYRGKNVIGALGYIAAVGCQMVGRALTVEGAPLRNAPRCARDRERPCALC